MEIVNKTLLGISPATFCDATNACRSGRSFAVQYPTMADVWDACPRVEWLCWMLERLGAVPDERKVREFLCWAAKDTPLADGRKTLDLLTDERSRNAVTVALRFARDEAGAAELSAARSAAARSAAGFAAESAARSAARSAAESATRSAARSAAWSAAESATRSATWFAAESAARSAALSATWSAAAAVNAAESAARSSARSAAGSAARSAQTDEFRRVFPNPFK